MKFDDIDNKNNQLISWSDFINYNHLKDDNITNIKCPKCGSVLYIGNLVLTCFPAKHQYVCKNCDWSGYA